MSRSKTRVLKTDKLYLNKNEIDLSLHDTKTIELINDTEFEKYKFCNVCGKYYPFHSNFFMREKRLLDGHENKCRLCRNGKFVNDTESFKMFNINKKESIINNYINFLESDVIKISDTKFLKDNIKEIMDYLIKDMTDDEVYNISRDWIKSKKIYGLSIHTYNGSIAHMFHKLYGDKYKPWLFYTVGTGYWNNEDNRKYAFNWFVTQLIDDNIIESEDNLNTIPLALWMNKYKLSGLFSHYKSAYALLNNYYPNKFKDYEMNTLMNVDKDMTKKCIRNYVFNTLNIKIRDIKYYISFNEIINAKDIQVRKVYRNAMLNNLFDSFNDLIEYCFDELDIKEYKQYNHKNYYMCIDSKIAKSSEERQLYYMLKNSGLNVDICNEYNDKYLMYDIISDTNYYPDFMIYKDNKIIIIEYYGYINKSGTFAKDIGYLDKHDRKVEYYTNRLDNNKYDYIGIYPDDLKKDDCKGLIDKFKDKGIKLIV